MDSSLGRLAFSRKSGESFMVGNLAVTVIRRTQDMTAQVIIQFPDSSKKHLDVRDKGTFKLADNISVSLTVDTRRGDRIGVVVEAPKSIRILREELLFEQKELFQSR